MLVCEAAGYGIVVIETVGVGQSEVRVAEMTDFLLVLMLAGAGDELQGIKRGLLELADLIAIAKADGANVVAAKVAASKYAYAMHLLADPEQGMAPVITCSALDGTGLEEIWKIISERTAERERSGYLHTRRIEQNINWMWSLVDQQIHDLLHLQPAVDAVARRVAAQVSDGALSPIMAAETIISALFADSGASGSPDSVGRPVRVADRVLPAANDSSLEKAKS
jgi:LAO/AO transport system kinase